jgi:hypothetical protein
MEPRPVNFGSVRCFRCSHAQWQDINDAAAKLGFTKGTFIRHTVMKEARKVLRKKQSSIT